jgi:hypothetical protein
MPGLWKSGCLPALVFAGWVIPALASGAVPLKKPHLVVLGAVKQVPYSKSGDPAGAGPTETTRKTRARVLDGRVREWTTGDAHDITDRSFVVRGALPVNDSLRGEKTGDKPRTEHWVWQRGPWLLIDRSNAHVAALKFPDFDPAVSNVSWFRDYAAYCGLSAGGKQLYAVVAQVAGRKPLLMKKISAWDLADHPSPACGPATWQREPLKVTFTPLKAGPPVSYALVGLSAVLVEGGDESEGEN